MGINVLLVKAYIDRLPRELDAQHRQPQRDRPATVPDPAVRTEWGIITAGAVLASLPVLLLYIPVQKYVISGLTAGSVKE